MTSPPDSSSDFWFALWTPLGSFSSVSSPSSGACSSSAVASRSSSTAASVAFDAVFFFPAVLREVAPAALLAAVFFAVVFLAGAFFVVFADAVAAFPFTGAASFASSVTAVLSSTVVCEAVTEFLLPPVLRRAGPVSRGRTMVHGAVAPPDPEGIPA
jgi:hypothetical protein